LNGSSTFTNLFDNQRRKFALGASERLSDLAPVLITATSATFDLNNFNETLGSLASSAAGKVTLGSGFLTAGGNNLSRRIHCHQRHRRIHESRHRRLIFTKATLTRATPS